MIILTQHQVSGCQAEGEGSFLTTRPTLYPTERLSAQFSEERVARYGSLDYCPLI